MPRRKEEPTPESAPRQQPATDPAAREQQMIGYADALAEKQLREGTASSQVMVHFLKLGTAREQLEREKLHQENLRMQAQIAALNSQKRSEDMMERVMDAIQRYGGGSDDKI